jgi:hypothetical protein
MATARRAVVPFGGAGRHRAVWFCPLPVVPVTARVERDSGQGQTFGRDVPARPKNPRLVPPGAWTRDELSLSAISAVSALSASPATPPPGAPHPTACKEITTRTRWTLFRSAPFRSHGRPGHSALSDNAALPHNDYRPTPSVFRRPSLSPPRPPREPVRHPPVVPRRRRRSKSTF